MNILSCQLLSLQSNKNSFNSHYVASLPGVAGNTRISMSEENATTVKVEFGRLPEWDNLEDPGEGGSARASRDVTIQDDSKDAQEGEASGDSRGKEAPLNLSKDKQAVKGVLSASRYIKKSPRGRGLGVWRSLEYMMKSAQTSDHISMTAEVGNARRRIPVLLSQSGINLLKAISEREGRTGSLSLYRKFTFSELEGDLFRNFFQPSKDMGVSDNLFTGAIMRLSLLAQGKTYNPSIGETEDILQSLARRKHASRRVIGDANQLADILLVLTNLFSIQHYPVTEDKLVTHPPNETFRDGGIFLLSSLIRVFNIPVICDHPCKASCCVKVAGISTISCSGCCLTHIKKCRRLEEIGV